MQFLSRPQHVAVLGLALASLFSIRVLAENKWDPSALVAFGEESVEITKYAEDKLVREVVKRDGIGHDGRFFFVQANDPLLVDPDENAEILDRPRYRSQRMLYPLLAGGAGSLSGEAILWSLFGINLAFVGLGTWAVSRLALRYSTPALLGLAFALNPGVLNELFIDGAGIVAFALACLGALALEEEKRGLATALLCGAVLAREVMLVFVGAIVLVWWIKRKTIPVGLATAPVVAAAAWFLYVVVRVEETTGATQVIELVPIPFSGLFDGIELGLFRPAEFLMAVVVLALCVLVPFRAWRSNHYLAWGASGFALLVPFLSAFVWSRVWDISRAVVPIFTVYVLQVFIARRQEQGLKPKPAAAD